MTNKITSNEIFLTNAHSLLWSHKNLQVKMLQLKITRMLVLILLNRWVRKRRIKTLCFFENLQDQNIIMKQLFNNVDLICALPKSFNLEASCFVRIRKTVA